MTNSFSIGKRKVIEILVTLVVVLLPVLLWLLSADVSQLFATPGSVTKALGKTAAFSAIAAYCLLPILSIRYSFIMRLFGGLSVAFAIHKKLGRVVFFIILAHPVLLIAGSLLQGSSITAVWNWTSAVVLSGIFALLSFVSILAVTIYAHIAHKKWLIIHRMFGWLLPVMFGHALLARSQMTKNPTLFIYISVLAGLGFLAFLYRSVFARIFIKKYPYKVVEVNNVHESVAELVLKPVGIPISYNAGQFAHLSLASLAVDNEAHPFSFASANNGPYVRFAIKALGDYTTNIKNVQVGDSAYLEGPYGNFSYLDSANKKQIWIAGGAGITPFLSMARSLSKKSSREIILFYAAEDIEDAVFLRELFQIRNLIPHVLTVHIVNRKVSGFVGMEMLKKILPDMQKYDYFICGPPAMAHSLKEGLHTEHVRPSQVFIEEFSML